MAHRHAYCVVVSCVLFCFGSSSHAQSRSGAAATAIEPVRVAEVAPQPGELVLGKTAPSAFAGTPLLHYLRQIGADTLIVCGESTSGCVRAAVLDAQALRYRIGISPETFAARSDLSLQVLDALSTEGIKLGRMPGAEPAE